MKNLYKIIGNPLENESVVDNILDAYCKNDRLYMGLIKNNIANKEIGMMSRSGYNSLHLLLFNDWRGMVHRVRCANYLKEPHKSKIDKLDDYLQRQNPTTTEEVNDIIYGKKTDNKELKELLDAFRWNSISDFSSWDHIDSSCVALGLHKRQSIEHRLYINCDSSQTHLIARKFIEKCKQAKSRYYFKYDQYGNRSDTIVIYSDTKHLQFYIDSINEIINENNLASSMHQPPFLTGKINDYIGYGSEPQEIPGKKLMSFNSKREKHLEECICKETASFISSNLGRRIRKNNEVISYSDYIIEDIVKVARANALKYLRDDEESNLRRGYSRKEINSSFFDITVINAVRGRLESILAEYKENKRITPITVPFGKGTLTISSTTLLTVIKNQIETVCKKSQNYRQNLLKRIKDTAHLYDIDKDNYAVDLSKCAMLGKGEEDDFSDTNNVCHEVKEEQPKIKRKELNYKPMSDAEIEEARKKLGFK